MIGNCQGCGGENRELTQCKVGAQAVAMCAECMKDWHIEPTEQYSHG